ncbi:hypothetical protein [Flagellimonas eckloniae]|uniref:Uncharacterized protein n=1 Tax=Flagellimonas eckloniae TaxID=346185 RepID=A0A0Q1DJ35_9FLAO|nr:hypothetical protein [Allomuricauda eckloniae]KQC28752.1 hypothetical protein AAY42_01735 [Allomuricauda eckloniae]
MSLKLTFRILTFSICFLFQNYSLAQHLEKWYLDENNIKISETTYQRKLDSDIYITEILGNKDTLIYRLQLKELLGVLEEKKRTQLFQILAQRNGVDTTKTIFIRYTDTLYSKEVLKGRKQKIPLKNGHTSYSNDYEQFIRNSKSWVKRKNKKLVTYNFYSHNQNSNDEFDGTQWHKDPLSLIKKMFSSFNSNYGFFLAIHPDGRYWVSNSCLTNNLDKKMVDDKAWNQHYASYQGKYLQLNPIQRK